MAFPLREIEPSNYPYPAYLIGLARSWIFEQPFHVLPVECTADPNWATAATTDEAAREEGTQFIGELISRAEENAGS